MIRREVERKALTEQLLDEVRERLTLPQVRDALGMRGVLLAGVAEWAYAPDVSGGVIRNVGDANAFPVVILDGDARVTSEATQMMIAQKNWLGNYLENAWSSRGYRSDRAEIDETVDRMDPTGRELALTLGGAHVQARLGFESVQLSDIGVQGPYLPIASRGRPHAIVRFDKNMDVMADALTHEFSHVVDATIDSTWPLDPELIRRERLRTELAAYATQVAVIDGHNAQQKWWQRHLRHDNLARRVEHVREYLNGPYASPDAFDPNERIEHALRRLHLGFIYQKYD